MTRLLTVSPLKMLDLWDQLHSAMAGTNSYGGDVVEFYFFQIMSCSPSVATYPESPLLTDDFYDAACNLHALCRLFEERHDVSIVFEGGGDIDQLLDKSRLNRHRTHLKVVHRFPE
jgi:hypothetical protein